MFARLAIPFAFCLAALFSGLLPAPSHAATALLPAPTVSYSADRVIESEAGTLTGKVYATQGMERQETNISGMQSVMILRHDKQVGYMLMPWRVATPGPAPAILRVWRWRGRSRASMDARSSTAGNCETRGVAKRSVPARR